VSLAASWATAVEYAMDNQLSGRGEALYLVQVLAFPSKLFTREQAVLFVLLVVLMGTSVS